MKACDFLLVRLYKAFPELTFELKALLLLPKHQSPSLLVDSAEYPCCSKKNVTIHHTRFAAQTEGNQKFFLLAGRPL